MSRGAQSEQRNGVAFGHLAVAAAVVLFLVAACVPTTALFDGSIGGDSSLYEQYGSQIVHGKIPYRDFFMEYPPGAIPAFAAPAAVGAHHELAALKALMLACALGILVLGAVSLRRVRADGTRTWIALGLFALAPLLLGPVLTTHYDPWPALLTAVALAALLSGRQTAGFAALGLATAAKVYPVLLLPLAALYVQRRWGSRAMWRGVAASAIAFGVVFLPFVLLGPGGVRYSLTYELRRPLQVESLGSSLLFGAAHLGLYHPHPVEGYGSGNLEGGLPSALSATTTVLELAVLVAIWVLFARGPRDDRSLLTASAATVVAAVALGKVLSPQYAVWLLPLVPLVAGWASATLFAAALVLTQSLRAWDGIGVNGSSWVLLARNLLLLALAAMLVAALRRRPSAVPGASART